MVELYSHHGMSMAELGRLYNCEPRIISKILKSRDVEITRGARRRSDKPLLRPSHITAKEGSSAWWTQNNDAYVEAIEREHPGATFVDIPRQRRLDDA